MKQDLNCVITDLVNLNEFKIEHLLLIDHQILLRLISNYTDHLIEDRHPIKIDFYAVH